MSFCLLLENEQSSFVTLPVVPSFYFHSVLYALKSGSAVSHNL
jgi:hypothetical protein